VGSSTDSNRRTSASPRQTAAHSVQFRASQSRDELLLQPIAGSSIFFGGAFGLLGMS